MTSTIYQRIEELNRKYRGDGANVFQPDREGDNFLLIDQQAKVMISAPHSVKQFRELEKYPDYLKGADIFTGGITEYLCQRTGCNGIIRTFNKKDDPNYYSHGPSGHYKDTICQVIEKNHCGLFLDIHGCFDYLEHDVYLGINGGANLCGNNYFLEKLMAMLADAGIDVVTDQDGMCAKYDHNVSRMTAERMGIPCIQIELRYPWRVKVEKVEVIIPILERFIKESMEYLNNEA